MVIMRQTAHVIGAVCVIVWRTVRALALVIYLLIMGAVWPFLILNYIINTKGERKALAMIKSTNKSIKSAARAL